MPPFVSTTCTHCHKANTYDWLEINAAKPGAKLFRSLTAIPIEDAHEFVVTCQHCHERFKIRVQPPGGENE